MELSWAKCGIFGKTEEREACAAPHATILTGKPRGIKLIELLKIQFGGRIHKCK